MNCVGALFCFWGRLVTSLPDMIEVVIVDRKLQHPAFRISQLPCDAQAGASPEGQLQQLMRRLRECASRVAGAPGFGM